MHLIDNWKAIALRAHSMWAQYLGVCALLTPEAIYLLWDIDTNPRIWFWIGLLLMLYGMIFRLLKQPKIPKQDRVTLRSGGLCGLSAVVLIFAMAQVPHKAPIAVAENEPPADALNAGPTYAQTAAYLTPLVKKWEGKHACADAPQLHCSYFDTIADPPLWTNGYGHTQTAAEGQRLTEAEATDQLKRDLRSYWSGVRRGFTKDTVANRLTPQRDAAFTSLGYNVGVAGVRKSTATRRLNAGDVAGACEALTWWNKAGGRVIRGLVNRRKSERALCLAGAVT